jgi:putative ABC transport system substrate-binding protein
MNPDNPAMGSILRAVEERGQALNVKVQAVNVRSVVELEAALKLAKAQTDGLIVVDDGLFIGNARRVADLAMRNRLPSVGFREYCEAGGLVAYGVDFPHIWRRSMIFVDKILRGANPRDLPVEQAQKFEFVINMTTAKTLGVTIPQSLLLRADEVIQ